MTEPTDAIPREFVGRLLNQGSDVPLAGFTVRAFDLDAGAEPEDLGYDMTNEDGTFATAYTVPTGGQAERRLLLRILNQQER